jgi:hypothetical protein
MGFGLFIINMDNGLPVPVAARSKAHYFHVTYYNYLSLSNLLSIRNSVQSSEYLSTCHDRLLPPK